MCQASGPLGFTGLVACCKLCKGAVFSDIRNNSKSPNYLKKNSVCKLCMGEGEVVLCAADMCGFIKTKAAATKKMQVLRVIGVNVTAFE